MSTVGLCSSCCISSIIQCIRHSRGRTGCASSSTYLSSRNAGTETETCSYIRSVRPNSNTNCQVRFNYPVITVMVIWSLDTRMELFQFSFSLISKSESYTALYRPVTFCIWNDFHITYYRHWFSAEVPGLSHDKLEELRLLRRTQKRKSITVDGGLEGMDSTFIQVRINKQSEILRSE